MKNDYKDFYVGSRAQSRSKKRKTNIILNSLIGIIVLLIIIVGANIFIGADSNEAGQETGSEQNNTEDNSNIGSDEEEDEEQSPEGEGDEGSTDDDSVTDDSPDADEQTEDDVNDESDTETDSNEDPSTGKQTIEENSDDPNVEETFVNASWQPIGTKQSEPHTKNFSSDSQDWIEMQQAIATALGTTADGLTYWCVENGGGNQVVGTVTLKGNNAEPYRVYIEWIDGEGYKPVKVQDLVENDKKSSC